MHAYHISLSSMIQSAVASARQRLGGGDPKRYTHLSHHPPFANWRRGAGFGRSCLGASKTNITTVILCDIEIYTHTHNLIVSCYESCWNSLSHALHSLDILRGLTAFAERSPTTPRRNWLSRLGRGLRLLAANLETWRSFKKKCHHFHIFSRAPRLWGSGCKCARRSRCIGF